MADQSVRIENLPDNSKHRVTFDLMNRIAALEFSERGKKDPEKGRDYYLELYAACRRVVF